MSKISMKDMIKLRDEVLSNRKKVLDALSEHPDLISGKKSSVAYDLYQHKDEIANVRGYKELRDIVVDILEKSSQPKAKEYLAKIKFDFDKRYNRDPRPRSYNEQYVFNDLWQFIYNIMLKAENLGSPDVKEKKEDSTKVKDEEKYAKDIFEQFCKKMNKDIGSRECWGDSWFTSKKYPAFDSVLQLFCYIPKEWSKQKFEEIVTKNLPADSQYKLDYIQERKIEGNMKMAEFKLLLKGVDKFDKDEDAKNVDLLSAYVPDAIRDSYKSFKDEMSFEKRDDLTHELYDILASFIKKYKISIDDLDEMCEFCILHMPDDGTLGEFKDAECKDYVAENGGWKLDSSKSWEAWEEYIDDVGAEHAADSLARALSSDELADNLIYIFREEDFNSKHLVEDCSKAKDEVKPSKGAQIAKIFAEELKGECGPMGGENPILHGNRLGLFSQNPVEWYIFNDDGSVDFENIEEVIEKNPDEWGIENDEKEKAATIAQNKHFNSIKDLIWSALAWFDYIDEDKVLNKVEEILKSETKDEALGEQQIDETIDELDVEVNLDKIDLSEDGTTDYMKEEYEHDIEIMPVGWTSRAQWEEFLQKAEWPYWLDWESLVNEFSAINATRKVK